MQLDLLDVCFTLIPTDTLLLSVLGNGNKGTLKHAWDNKKKNVDKAIKENSIIYIEALYC